MNTAMRFVVVGIIGAIVELALFSGLIKINCEVAISNFIAFHCAFVICFLLHYYYTYKKPYREKQKVIIGFIKYICLMYGQLIVGTLLLLLFINKLDWMPEVAKFVQIGIVAPISFVLQKFNIFKVNTEA